MTSHHSQQGIDQYRARADSADTASAEAVAEQAAESAPIADSSSEGVVEPPPEAATEAAESASVEPMADTTVVPFDREITIAKTQLERLIERIDQDTESLKARMVGVEALAPRQGELAREAEEAARRTAALGELAEGVRGKLERLESGHQALAEGSAEEIATITAAIARLDERVSDLEPTPEKLELLAVKLERVDARLALWTEQLEGRVDLLDEQQRGLAERTGALEAGVVALTGRVDELKEDHQQVKGETHRLLRSTDVLTILLERLEARLGRHTRLGAMALGLLAALGVIALVFGYARFDDERVAMSGKLQGIERVAEVRDARIDQRIGQVESGLVGSSEALGEALTEVRSGMEQALAERFAAAREELTRLEQAFDARLNPRYDPTSNAITISVHDEDWVLKRDPARHGVELLVAEGKGALFNYIRHFQPQLTQPVAYTRVSQRGREWYLLLYGDYAGATEARAALAELPAEMRRYRPRVHAYGRVQRLMAD